MFIHFNYRCYKRIKRFILVFPRDRDQVRPSVSVKMFSNISTRERCGGSVAEYIQDKGWRLRESRYKRSVHESSTEVKDQDLTEWISSTRGQIANSWYSLSPLSA